MIAHRFLVVSLLCFGLAGLHADQAAAWSESGHHLVALLAIDELTPEEQQKLLAILAAHPRYVEDFTPSEKIRNVDRFRVGTAGYWPDIARSQPKYNRPSWHYQLGATLTLGDPSQLQVPETPGPLPPEATLEAQELYIAQAVELCRRTLGDPRAAPGDRSLALCWLAHLVGDAHQPCHAGSLYAAGLFPDGDRGANSIPTRQKNNMHALWDGLLGGSYDEGAMNRRVKEMKTVAWSETTPPIGFARRSSHHVCICSWTTTSLLRLWRHVGSGPKIASVLERSRTLYRGRLAGRGNSSVVQGSTIHLDSVSAIISRAHS